MNILLLFITYLLIYRPYQSAPHNLHTIICHLVMLTIASINYYYCTILHETPLEVKGRILKPIIGDIVIIGLSIMISTSLLGREVRKRIWEGKK